MSDPLLQALEQIAGPHLQCAAPRPNGQPSNVLSAHPVILEANSRGAVQKLAALGFARCRWFVVLPSRKAPRWLLPLGSSQATKQSLDICAAYSPRARAMKGFLSALIKMNRLGWVRRGMVLASKGPLPLERLVAEVTGETAPVFALSLGSPHRFHKVTVQVMRPSGEILCYIKFPLTEAATERVRHEAAMLAFLRCFADLRPHIPGLLHAGEWGNSYIVFQSCGPARLGPMEFGSAHEEFLRTLQGVRPVKKPARAITEEVERRWQSLEQQLGAELRQLGRGVIARARQQLDGSSVPCGIHHGDFAPWNTREEGGHLFLFDWESASLEAPVCWDAYHFRVQLEGLLNRKNGRRASAGKPEGEDPVFLLYVLNSLGQLLEEDPPDRSGIEYRRKLLRESVH